jgi:Scaffold protein Nfu/NifU N terminal
MVRIDPTPNPNAIKLTVDRALSAKPVTHARGAADPLAAALFAIDGVASVFVFQNYVTVTKRADAEWGAIQGPIEEAVRRATA